MIGHRISAVRPNVKGPFQVLDRSRRLNPALWLAIQHSIGGALSQVAATACRLRIRRRPPPPLAREEPGREPPSLYINPGPGPILSPAPFPPSVPQPSLLFHNRKEPAPSTLLLYTHTHIYKMAPYAPAQVQLLHSWDTGSYSPMLDADDRYPTIEPSDEQYPGPYLSNILPPLSSTTSLLRSPSHRNSWSCHSSDEHQQCCDSGAATDSPQYRTVPYTDGDYVYSSDGYISSQHTPNDQVSPHPPPPRPSFWPIQLILAAISNHLVLLLR